MLNKGVRIMARDSEAAPFVHRTGSCVATALALALADPGRVERRSSLPQIWRCNGLHDTLLKSDPVPLDMFEEQVVP